MAFHATVSGSVQGVGFRYTARREASRLGLTGWIRNLPDGDVELVAEGEAGALADFRSWLEEGPPGAWVRRVAVDKLAPTGHYSDFSIE
jgi:acylphosphatase